HYLGIWGTEGKPNAVFSAQSVPSYQEPWRIINRLETRIAQLKNAERLTREAAKAQRAKIQHYEAEIANSKLGEMKQQEVTAELARQIQDERARILFYAEQIPVLLGQIDSLRIHSQELETLKEARLGSKLERQLVQCQTKTDELPTRLHDLLQFES